MTTTAIIPPKPAVKTATPAAGPVAAAAATTATATGPTGVTSQPTSLVRSTVARSKSWSGEDRYQMIAEAAYFRAERRGFLSGSELQDWLAAEAEVDDLLGDLPTR